MTIQGGATRTVKDVLESLFHSKFQRWTLVRPLKNVILCYNPNEIVHLELRHVFNVMPSGAKVVPVGLVQDAAVLVASGSSGTAVPEGFLWRPDYKKDDHAGLRAAQKAIFGGALWQCSQFHIQLNRLATNPRYSMKEEVT